MMQREARRDAKRCESSGRDPEAATQSEVGCGAWLRLRVSGCSLGSGQRDHLRTVVSTPGASPIRFGPPNDGHRDALAATPNVSRAPTVGAGASRDSGDACTPYLPVRI